MKRWMSILLTSIVVIILCATSVWAAPFIPGGLNAKLTKATIQHGQAVELAINGGTAPYTITLREQGIGQKASLLAKPEGGGEWKLIRSVNSVNTYQLQGLKAGEYVVDIQDSKSEKLSVRLTVKPAR